MPLDTSIKKVLVIGSGPIVIGQAAEFDYAGAQACRVLKDAGVEVVLCNSNPATIMTDQAMADEIYLEPLTVEAVLVQAADAISGARPGARRESLENYVKRLEKLEEIADSFPGVEKSFAIQAGREVRVMVKPEVVDDTATVFLAKEVAKKIEAEMEYPGQIKVNVIREMRSVEYAK